MSETADLLETTVETEAPETSEEDRHYMRKLKKILGAAVFVGALGGGLFGWLDGKRQESYTNAENHEKAEALQRCANYLVTADLTKDSTIRVRSLPTNVRKDCGFEDLPLNTADYLDNEGLAIGLTPGFKEAKTDIVLRYDDDALAAEIGRLERDASDIAQGYSVIEGLVFMGVGGAAGFVSVAGSIVIASTLSYQIKLRSQSAVQQ